MNRFVYVDISNLFIEGQRVAAVKSSRAPSLSAAHEVMKQGGLRDWRINMGGPGLRPGLYGLLQNGLPVQSRSGAVIKRALVHGSYGHNDEGFWARLHDNGWETVVHERAPDRREKGVDTGLVNDLVNDAHERISTGIDEIVLVAGDGDYTYVVNSLSERGHRVTVVFWDHARRDLKEAACSFFSLDEHLHSLSLPLDHPRLI